TWAPDLFVMMPLYHSNGRQFTEVSMHPQYVQSVVVKPQPQRVMGEDTRPMRSSTDHFDSFQNI
ncbi:MAG TPA: hypothetical protein VHS96_14165, partial [Bacteroidia bacterium]|nr:hypothetical protein [Bacteroidia bacterium]